MGNYDNLFTIADYAKKIGVTSGAVDSWIKAVAGTADDIQTAAVFGNTRVYDIADLEKLELSKGKAGQIIRERGYVLPDQHKALETRYFEMLRVSAETKIELDGLTLKYNDLMDRVRNGGDAAEEYANLTAELTKANERITEQNAIIVRTTFDNTGLTEKVSELEAVLSKANERNDALILDNLSKDQRIESLKNEVAHLGSQTIVVDMDADEKLSDAYAEIQTLKEKLKAAEAGIISG